MATKADRIEQRTQHFVRTGLSPGEARALAENEARTQEVNQRAARRAEAPEYATLDDLAFPAPDPQAIERKFLERGADPATARKAAEAAATLPQPDAAAQAGRLRQSAGQAQDPGQRRTLLEAAEQLEGQLAGYRADAIAATQSRRRAGAVPSEVGPDVPAAVDPQTGELSPVGFELGDHAPALGGDSRQRALALLAPYRGDDGNYHLWRAVNRLGVETLRAAGFTEADIQAARAASSSRLSQEHALMGLSGYRGEGGYDLVAALAAGVSASQLDLAGFTAQQIADAQVDTGAQGLRSAAYRELTRWFGATTEDGQESVNLVDALAAEVSVSQLELAGFTAQQIADARLDLTQFRKDHAEFSQVVRSWAAAGIYLMPDQIPLGLEIKAREEMARLKGDIESLTRKLEQEREDLARRQAEVVDLPGSASAARRARELLGHEVRDIERLLDKSQEELAAFENFLQYGGFYPAFTPWQKVQRAAQEALYRTPLLEHTKNVAFWVASPVILRTALGLLRAGKAAPSVVLNRIARIRTRQDVERYLRQRGVDVVGGGALDTPPGVRTLSDLRAWTRTADFQRLPAVQQQSVRQFAALASRHAGSRPMRPPLVPVSPAQPHLAPVLTPAPPQPAPAPLSPREEPAAPEAWGIPTPGPITIRGPEEAEGPAQEPALEPAFLPYAPVLPVEDPFTDPPAEPRRRERPAPSPDAEPELAPSPALPPGPDPVGSPAPAGDPFADPLGVPQRRRRSVPGPATTPQPGGSPAPTPAPANRPSPASVPFAVPVPTPTPTPQPGQRPVPLRRRGRGSVPGEPSPPTPRLKIPRPPWPTLGGGGGGQVGRGKLFPRLEGHKQGFVYRYKDRQTGQEIFSRDPRYGRVPNLRGKGSARRSHRTISYGRRPPTQHVSRMGALNVHYGQGVRFRRARRSRPHTRRRSR